MWATQAGGDTARKNKGQRECRLVRADTWPAPLTATLWNLRGHQSDASEQAEDQ